MRDTCSGCYLLLRNNDYRHELGDKIYCRQCAAERFEDVPPAPPLDLKPLLKAIVDFFKKG